MRVAERKAGGRRAAFLKVVKWILFLTVLVFVGRALVRQFTEVSLSEVNIHVPLAVLAVGSIFAVKILGFVPYCLLLGRFSHRPSWSAMMGAMGVAQISKYVPGKVASVVSLVLLLRRYDVPGRVAVGALFLIDGLCVILGMMLAIPLTLWEPVRANLPMAWLWCTIAMTAGLLCLHPRVFGTVGNYLLKRFGYQPFQTLPKVRDYFWPAVAILVQFCALGLGYWLSARALTDVPISSLPIFVCAVTLAGIGGFLAFFAPSGLGVQEGLLLVTLAPLTGGATAAILIVVMRLVQTLAEILLALIGYAIVRRGPVTKQDQQGQSVAPWLRLPASQPAKKAADA